jgi:hypothetical protein
MRDFRKPGWCRIQNSFIDRFARPAGPYGCSVYLYLCRHAWNDEVCNKSATEIARDLGCSKATVLRTLNKLENQGVIKIERSCGSESSYRLLDLPRLHRCKYSADSPLDWKQTDSTPVSDSTRTSTSHEARNKEEEIQDYKTGLPPSPLSGERGVKVQVRFTSSDPWQAICERLKSDLCSNRRFWGNEDNYDKYFRDTWLVNCTEAGVVRIDSSNLELAREGLKKYEQRLLTITKSLFGAALRIEVVE